MVAKEKAKELVDKFFQYSDAADELAFAIECALIAVDEIIQSLKITLAHLGFLKVTDSFEFLKDIGYWQEVKTEIEKL